MNRLIRCLALCTAVGLPLAACDKKDAETAAGKAEAVKKGAKAAGKAAGKAVDKAAGLVGLGSDTAVLAHIPADSPYVFAMLEPVPEAVVDKLFTGMKPILDKAEAELTKELAKLATREGEQAKLQKAILEELTGNLNKDGFKKLGFGSIPRATIYGVGLMPVVRIALEDPKKLRAAIARVETKSGMKAPTKKLGDTEYWSIDEDGMSFALAIMDKELIMSFAPTPAFATVLPYALGQKKPAKSLKDAGTLQAIASANGFTGHGTGYIDLVNIFGTILGDGKGLNGEIWKGIGSPVPPQSPDCKSEYMAMANNFPRMVFGYTEFTDKRFAAKYIVESKASWAKDLAGLAAGVPGLNLEGSGLFNVGFGLDVAKTVAFGKKIVADIKANPYKCEHLTEINENIGMAEQGLNQPMPPALAGIKGLNLVVDSGDFTSDQPKNVKAVAVIAADKPMELFQMAQGMVPPLAQIKIAADGKPVAIPAGLIPPVVDAPHLAISKAGLALSVGVGQEAKLGAALSAAVPSNKPLFALGYDIKQFMEMMAKSGQMGQEEIMIFNAMAGMMKRTSYAMYTNEKGIVFEQLVTLP